MGRVAVMSRWIGARYVDLDGDALSFMTQVTRIVNCDLCVELARVQPFRRAEQ